MALGVEKYYIQIMGAASSEKILLEDNLLIGSEVASGLKLSHPHLSSEHCSISVQSGVLSIIDLNSDLGIEINGKKIPPNKMIIILPSDDIKIGDLTIKIHTFEDPTLSVDHTTKILSLDDLMHEESKDTVHVPANSNEEIKNESQEDLTFESPINMVMLNNVVNPESQGPKESGQKIELKQEMLMREPVNEYEQTQSSIPQTTVDPLAKFKRGNKLPDSHASAVKTSKKNLQKFKKKSHKYYFSQFSSVSFPLRIFAFILDLILGVRLSLFLIEKEAMSLLTPLIDFINFSFDFVFNLHPDTAYLSEHMISFSSYFVGYLLLRIIGNLLFGASPGQLIIGCWNDGNFIVKRILGPVRELLGFVLAPLLIFDLPSLFSKKTVKEMLTMTGLECYNKTLSYVLALTLIPALFILSYFSPLLLYPVENSAVTITPESHKIKINENLSSAQTTASNFYRINASWSNALYRTYLNFKLVTSKDKNKVYVPRITFVPVDPNSHLLVRLERKKEFSWDVQLEEIIKMYPVLTNRFSALGQIKNKNSKEYSTQLKQIVQDSFDLNQDNLMNFVLNYGPYLDPFLKFKKSLKHYFQGEIENVEFWKNANLEFIFVSTKSADVAGRWREFYILPLTPFNTYIYQCSYLKDTYAKSKNLIKQFFALAKIQEKPSANMKTWKGTELESPELLDFYSLKSLSEQEKAVMSPFIYRYYWNIAKAASDTSFELFWADYSNNIRTAVGMLSEMNRSARKVANPQNDPLSDVGYDHLIKKLSLLREAVKNKQTTLFQQYIYP